MPFEYRGIIHRTSQKPYWKHPSSGRLLLVLFFIIGGVKIISDTIISWSYLVFSFILLKFFGPEAKEPLVLNYV